MEAIIVCGSMAYDTILVFQDRFRNRILSDQIHILNVAFHVPEVRQAFGGCAGNIAYGLKLLGMDPIIVAAMGRDAGAYLKRLQALGIRDCGIRIHAELLTAQAYIITDLDDNQITAFHPGAMARAAEAEIDPAWQAVYAIVSPDDHQAMMHHADRLSRLQIPFIFDPGQALPLFTREELIATIAKATALVVNDYEGKMIEERTGRSLSEFAAQLQALIVTRGAEGALLWEQGQVRTIRAAPAEKIIDPTGCGDAFRAGVLCAKALGGSWYEAAVLGAVLAAEKISSEGGQNYRISLKEALQRAARLYPDVSLHRR